MASSYGVTDAPEGALAGKYDVHNGEFAGEWYFSEVEVKAAEKEVEHEDAFPPDAAMRSSTRGARQ